ncbi:insulinase family protein [Nanoarchaeota archaeon NZ13-N]|uniref:Peptidase M16 n=1 Tax=Candidatus Nanoclepta minutus TaxID=1940235 RepID=A0A397WP27_9ARCH|nr:MAG: insulinase family protein [Nanoarchaeota archaeon NZ13-N]RIB35672.1 MAG: hypothetical protein BXU00_01055 [Candidatus Nanoclepta minutus]
MKVETLDNGIRVYTLPIEGVKTIGIGIYVNIGSIYEEKDYRGISHFLEHMMFKTNKKYKAHEIDMGLELNGGLANAVTSAHYTLYFFECIKESFNKIVDVLYSIFENSSYIEEEFENEKKVIISEIERCDNDPEEKLYNLVQKSVFGESDYGERIGGSIETIKNITKDILEEFKAKYYSPKNMFIILEGNVGEKEMDTIRKYFSMLEGDDVKLKRPSKDKGRDIYEEMDTKDIIYYAISKDFDLKDLLKAYTLSSIISGGISSKIFQIFRNKYGIGYHVFLEYTLTYPDSFIFTFGVPGFDKEKENKIYDAIDDLLNERITEDYINGRINRLNLKFQKSRNLLFERIPTDAFLIKYFGITYDNLLEIVKKESKNIEDLNKMLKDVFEGYEVWIKPK